MFNVVLNICCVLGMKRVSYCHCGSKVFPVVFEKCCRLEEIDDERNATHIQLYILVLVVSECIICVPYKFIRKCE